MNPIISDREFAVPPEQKIKRIPMTPWAVQGVVYELLENHFLTNSPADLGFTFTEKYSKEKAESDILLDISYNWKADVANKRPAVFISRTDAAINYPTIGQAIGSNTRESQSMLSGMISMPVTIAIIGGPVGFLEKFAEYVRFPFLYFSQEIERDFRFHKFRLQSISAPKLFPIDAKDHFIIELTLQIVFTDNWIVKGDDLKLKNISFQVFDSLTKKPLNLQ